MLFIREWFLGIPHRMAASVYQQKTPDICFRRYQSGQLCLSNNEVYYE
jgi:hypothetical protein